MFFFARYNPQIEEENKMRMFLFQLNVYWDNKNVIRTGKRWCYDTVSLKQVATLSPLLFIILMYYDIIREWWTKTTCQCRIYDNEKSFNWHGNMRYKKKGKPLKENLQLIHQFLYLMFTYN